ncbi:MAG: IS110 family transposase [Luteolibacter sp.]|uniref:IS110 family transposase n=1 Tax=Luteolibacter sp. TaxID=1962973 RepID=UPI00326376C6
MNPPEIKLTHALGIDIAKATFQVALMARDRPDIYQEKSFDNTSKGHAALLKWLGQQRVDITHLHACMEATGPYGDALACRLDGKLARLSVENPRRIKGYAACRNQRSKSDPADARLIAHYCASQRPPAWQRPSAAQFKIRALSRRLDSLKIQINAEKNRLGLTIDPFVKRDLKAHLQFLQRHIQSIEAELLSTIQSDAELSAKHQLLCGIKGVGSLSGAIILAEPPDLTVLRDARQLAAYAGVTPRHKQSGTSGSNYTPMSKAGSSRLRKALFFPAMSAMRFNPICKSFATRLTEKGKKSIVVIGAIMTKLLHIMFGILRSGQPFNPSHLTQPKTA